MPIYEYSCENCGTIEAMRRITEAPLRRCPNCKGKIERVLSRSSFVLKGSGWYATDYARKGASPPPGSTGKSAANGAPAGKDSAKSPEPPAKTIASPDQPASKPAAD